MSQWQQLDLPGVSNGIESAVGVLRGMMTSSSCEKSWVREISWVWVTTWVSGMVSVNRDDWETLDRPFTVSRRTSKASDAVICSDSRVPHKVTGRRNRSGARGASSRIRRPRAPRRHIWKPTYQLEPENWKRMETTQLRILRSQDVVQTLRSFWEQYRRYCSQNVHCKRTYNVYFVDSQSDQRSLNVHQ